MTVILTAEKALSLLRKYGNSEERISHCLGVSEVASEISVKIKQKNPKLYIDPKKITLAALLHDIGRGLEGHHELNTIKILEKEGLGDISKIVIHGFIYEQMFLETCKWDKKYLPSSLENKIVAISDMYYNQNKQRVSLQERLLDIEQRFKNDQNMLDAVKLGKPRMQLIENEIRALM